MNNKLESNSHFRSEIFKLSIKDYLILSTSIIANFFLVILFIKGNLEFETILKNHLIYFVLGVIISIITTKLHYKKNKVRIVF
jgi:hypothetical protein